jgi:F0F1-type ATP synthase beta subunit
VGGANDSEGPVLQVVQQVGDGLVRCVARGNIHGIVPGAAVAHRGEPLLAPLDPETLVRVVQILGASRRTDDRARQQGSGDRPAILETGIKAIDLMCPFTRGGTVGIFGPNGAGRMVISAEVLRNVAQERSGVTILAFLNGELEGRALFDAPDEALIATGTNQIVFLPIENAIDDASAAALAVSPLLDARIYLSFTLAKRGIWPAIDPLRSVSDQMDPAIIGREHYEVALAVRDILRHERALLEAAPDGRSHDLSDADRRLIARARKVQRFLSQPFAVATPFTGRPGQVVPVAATLHAFKALVAGEYDDLPEEAFAWRGALT